jgi:hypothetical protein
MSRSMLPPPSLSKEDVKTLADVRRDIWTQAWYGMGIGSACGGIVHAAVSYGSRKKLWGPFNATRNSLMAAIIMGGTLGSFLLATTTGKNEVHNLHPIYQRGAIHPPLGSSDAEGDGDGAKLSSSSYHEGLQRAQLRESDLRTLERSRTLSHRASLPIVTEEVDELSVERVQRERNRLFRRASLSQQLEGGGGGLSDSHGGRWVK